MEIKLHEFLISAIGGDENICNTGILSIQTTLSIKIGRGLLVTPSTQTTTGSNERPGFTKALKMKLP